MTHNANARPRKRVTGELAGIIPGHADDGTAIDDRSFVQAAVDQWPNPPQAIITTRGVSFSVRSTGRIYALEVMPGGRVISAGPRDGAVEIRHPETGEIERTLQGVHTDSVMAMASTPAGIFTCGADSSVSKWSNVDLASELKVKQDGLVTSAVYAAQLGHTGLFTAVASDNAPIVQWNIETGDEVAKLANANGAVLCLAADDAYVYAGTSDGSIVAYETLDRTIACIASNVHSNEVWCLHCDDAGVLVSVGADAVVRIWNFKALQTGVPLQELRGHERPLRAATSFEGIVFAAGDDGFVSVWDTRRDGNAPVELLFARVAVDGRTGRQRVLGPVTEVIDRVGSENFTGLQTVSVHHPQSTESSDDQGPPTDATHTLKLSGDGMVRVTLGRRITALNLHGNELTAAGFDGYIVKWNVETVLPSAMETFELPPLVGGVDAERAMFASLSIEDRHERLQRRDVRRALQYYTELPINYVLESLYLKVLGSWLSMEFFPFVLFLTLFTVFVLNEYSIIDIYNMTLGVQQKIEQQSIGGFKDPRTFTEVRNAHKFETFLRGAFVPKLWEQKPDASAWYDPVYFAGQNEMASAVRFRTQRAKNTSCSFENHRFRTDIDLDLLRGTGCYHDRKGIKLEDQSQDAFACLDPRTNNCSHDPDEIRRLFNFSSGLFEFSADGNLIDALKFYGAGGFAIDIPMTVSMSEALQRVDAFLRNGFIDNVATRVVFIEFFHYNAALDIFVSHKFIAELLPGGAWFTRVLHFPFAVFDANASVGRLIFEAFFCLFVLGWAVKFVSDAVRYYRLNGNVIGYLFDVWTLLEFVNVSLFLTSFGLRWSWYVQSDNLDEDLRTRPFDTSRYPAALDGIRNAFLLQVYLNSVNTVLTYLKVLKYVQLNDKLNILTRTLSLASQNIIGVLLLFVYFVFAFAMCGYVLYGTNVFEYRTPDAAYNSMLRLLIGDYDYDALSTSNRSATVVFFWAYTVLSVFLLLNFLIAVLADAFNEAVDSRLPIPIDDAIVRAASDLARSVSVRAIRITIVLFMNRSSKTAMTAQFAASLRKYRDTLLDSDARRRRDFQSLESHYITREFFLDSVPEMLKTSENLNFMDEVWQDLAYEWHFRLRDRANRHRHEQQELVDEVVAGELKDMKRLLDASSRGVREMSTLGRNLRAYFENVNAGPAQQGGITSMGSNLYIPPVQIRRRPDAAAEEPEETPGLSPRPTTAKDAVADAQFSGRKPGE